MIKRNINIHIHQSISDVTSTVISDSVCSENPCLNEGLCLTVSGGGVRCVCQTGYTGILCDITGSLIREIDLR